MKKAAKKNQTQTAAGADQKPASAASSPTVKSNPMQRARQRAESSCQAALNKVIRQSPG
jgi:hypothetical protein